MPDLGFLVELADYYHVDIREIIDGERKSEIMEKEEKETLLKLADYSDKQKKQAILKAFIVFSLGFICCGYTIAFMIFSLQSENQMSMWYALVPLIITVFYAVALILHAKDYVRKIQK